jgi:hypothetical protein
LDKKFTKLVQNYNLIQNEVRLEMPEEWKGVIKLCRLIPKNINNIHTIWRAAKDKPCWSNIKVNLGERMCKDLSGSKSFNDFSIIGSPEWEIYRKPKNRKSRANSNFQLIGESVKDFVNSLESGGLKSYRWRLYSICDLAKAFNTNNKIHGLIEELLTKQYIDSDRIKDWVTEFSRHAGFGWGYVTTNHMLTDLGLSIKPDIHVRRSAVRMGMLPQYSKNLMDKKIDALPKSVDFQIIETILKLVESGEVEPTAITVTEPVQKRKVALREIDKVLMEWSRQRSPLSRPL